MLEGNGTLCYGANAFGGNSSAAADACARFAAQALTDVQAAVDVASPPQWGIDLHHAEFTHTILNGSALVRCVGDRTVQHGGDDFTVNVGHYVPYEDSLPQDSGPSYRQVVDLSALATASVFIAPPGQSGNEFQGDYDNELSMWAEGTYLPMRAGVEGLPGVRTTTVRP